MFNSRKFLDSPLGKIWMFATMESKLDELNLIHICEEILNPSAHKPRMDMRLSAILMGGVVIVYERKVKLLYDDATRLLSHHPLCGSDDEEWRHKNIYNEDEINKAWKVKAARDRTLLQAKKKVVTLPEAREEDVGGIEQSLNDLSNAYATMGFPLRLDDVDDSYFNIDPQEHLHQARPEDITFTLYERFESCEVNTYVFNHFERFYTEGGDGRVDTEGDESTQPNFTYGEHATIINSPPPEEVKRAEEIPDHQVKSNLGEQDEQRQGPVKRKRRKQAGTVVDNETVCDSFKSLLADASSIVSRRGARKTVRRDLISTMKVKSLMELPPTIFIGDSSSYGNHDIYYPKPLMELWMKSTQPAHDSPSARTSPPLPPEPSISLPETERHQYQEAMGFNFEDFHGGGEASDSLGVSIEQFRTDVANYEIPMDILMGEQSANLRNHHGLNITGASFSTPVNDGHDIPPLYAELNLERRMKSYFEAPRAPQEESLNTFADGMEAKYAAKLFYQNCVLASCDVLVVKQKLPYSDIFISKGRKM